MTRRNGRGPVASRRRDPTDRGVVQTAAASQAGSLLPRLNRRTLPSYSFFLHLVYPLRVRRYMKKKKSISPHFKLEISPEQSEHYRV